MKGYVETKALVLQGDRVARRPHWGGAYVFYAEVGTTTPDGKTLRPRQTKSEESPCLFLHGAPETGLYVAPVLCLRRSDGVIELGWRPSLDDEEARDWQTMTFEALQRRLADAS